MNSCMWVDGMDFLLKYHYGGVLSHMISQPAVRSTGTYYLL